MRAYVENLVDRSAKLLRQSYPVARKQECWTVAYGVVSICFNHESLTPLEPPPKYGRAAKAAAKALIATLNENEQDAA